MNRLGSTLGISLLVLAAQAGCRPAPTPPQARPNILLISLDALRADRLSCYGNPRETSPFLDELAARGTRFVTAFSNSHATDSSHTSMLSGQHPESHGVSMIDSWDTQNRVNIIPDEIPLVQELLDREGYATLGVTSGGWVAAELGFASGFDAFDDSLGDVGQGAERLLELVRERAGGPDPIFVFFHTYEVHSPYWPPPRYRTLFGEYGDRREPTSSYLRRICPEASKHLDEDDWEFLLAMYDGEIRYTDDTLRELFAELESIGFLDNALVIVTSDHGEEFGEHGGCLHAGMYNEVLHVPMILSGSVVPGGETIDRLVSVVDIAPTILATAGIAVPPGVAGSNLLGPPPGAGEQELVVSQAGPYVYAIQTRDWKLLTIPDPDFPDELYHLREDPGETNDVAEENPEQTAAMHRLLEAWQARNQRPAVEGPEATLDEERIEKLRSLGYVD